MAAMRFLRDIYVTIGDVLIDNVRGYERDFKYAVASANAKREGTSKCVTLRLIGIFVYNEWIEEETFIEIYSRPHAFIRIIEEYILTCYIGTHGAVRIDRDSDGKIEAVYHENTSGFIRAQKIFLNTAKEIVRVADYIRNGKYNPDIGAGESVIEAHYNDNEGLYILVNSNEETP